MAKCTKCGEYLTFEEMQLHECEAEDGYGIYKVNSYDQHCEWCGMKSLWFLRCEHKNWERFACSIHLEKTMRLGMLDLGENAEIVVRRLA